MSNDPIERLVAEGLRAAKIEFQIDGKANTERLDFMFGGPNGPIYIEVKAYHTDRISEQMSRVDNVIAIQGKEAARWFTGCLKELAELREAFASTTPAL